MSSQGAPATEMLDADMASTQHIVRQACAQVVTDREFPQLFVGLRGDLRVFDLGDFLDGGSVP